MPSPHEPRKSKPESLPRSFVNHIRSSGQEDSDDHLVSKWVNLGERVLSGVNSPRLTRKKIKAFGSAGMGKNKRTPTR